MSNVTVYADPSVTVQVLPGSPPVDQTALVASLQAQVAALQAQIASAKTDLAKLVADLP